jgi:hypothetical protein
MSPPPETYRLVTVNSDPERAKRLVGRVIGDLQTQYTVIHVANAESKYEQHGSESHGEH